MSTWPRVEPVTTADGSSTLYDVDLKVHYRSVHGAAQEARAVFLQATGLLEREGDWRVLELGLGGATTLTQTILAHRRRALDPTQARSRLLYTSVEARPVHPDALAPLRLDPLTRRPAELACQALERARADAARGPILVQDADLGVELRLVVRPWLTLEEDPLDVDALFFDPFGPEADPEAWTQACFAIAAKHLHPTRGLLATYSAAGHVRRAMRGAGLWTGSLPGPAFKREITLAALDARALTARGVSRLRAPTQDAP